MGPGHSQIKGGPEKTTLYNLQVLKHPADTATLYNNHAITVTSYR